jgi:cell division protein FtsB
MKIVFYIFVIGALLIVIRNITATLLDNVQGKSIISSYESRLIEQKKHHEFLKEQLMYVQGRRFIEEEARNKLGLVQSGEVIVIAPIEKKQAVLATVHTKDAVWKQWVRLFN